jgi:hypothetical protein
MKDEALDKALDALEDLQRQYSIYPNSFWDWSKGRKAIAAIKQALDTTPPAAPVPLTEQQKQELAENWFAEDWAITKAMGMMYDHERLLGITEKGQP